MLISCGAEYNAHAADTIKPTPAETLVLIMKIFFLAPVVMVTQNSKYGKLNSVQGSSEAI